MRINTHDIAFQEFIDIINGIVCELVDSLEGRSMFSIYKLILDMHLDAVYTMKKCKN